MLLGALALCACTGKSDPIAGGILNPRMGSAGMSAVEDEGVGGSDNPSGVLVTTMPQMAAAAGSGGRSARGTTSSRMPVSLDDCAQPNPAGLSDADVQKLRSASDPGELRWLYPYEGTVFPRGMSAPLLMWEGGASASAAYVHIRAAAFEYRGCLQPTAAGQLLLPEEVWDKAGEQTAGKSDPYTLELSLLDGSEASGPIRLTFTIAQATIKGSIYYSSYESRLSNATQWNALIQGGGMVLRIPQGGSAEVFANTGCVGCHSVSADGSDMIAQLYPGSGQSYELTAGGMANPPAANAGPRASYGAMYPDGSAYLAMSGAIDVARSLMVQGANAPQDATVYDTATGQTIPSRSIPPGALMPMFSPDGAQLVFNDYALDGADGLALMKYDVATHTASNYRVLMMDGEASRPGWPFFLPDNHAVIFVRTESTNFSGNSVGLATTGGGIFGNPAPMPGANGPYSELHIADLTSGTITVLARAMGFASPEDAASETTYLPFGADELHSNYYPTVSPVAAGGYFWVFFDSYRHYGNLGKHRQLWGAAIEIQSDGHYAKDVSHPAFYLPGQELMTGNHRAFASLDPCKQDGDSCASGIDCCGGFCYLPDSTTEFVKPVGTCNPPMDSCARRDERCTSDADCCPTDPGVPPNYCIAGFCAYVNLQ